jgi:hypothetical protein
VENYLVALVLQIDRAATNPGRIFKNEVQCMAV